MHYNFFESFGIISQMTESRDQEGQLPLPEKTFSVSEYVELWNNFFKKIKPAKVLGEISQVKSGPSGHIYFTIKDKSGTSILDCIIWNRNYLMCGVKLEVGMEVILQGRPSIYGPSGRFSFIADTAELDGDQESLRRTKKEAGEGGCLRGREETNPAGIRTQNWRDYLSRGRGYSRLRK